MPAVATDAFEIHLESDAFPWEDLKVRALTGREQISRLSSFDVELVSSAPAPGLAAAMLGAGVTVVIEHVGQSTRRIHGTVVEVTDLLASEADIRVLRARVVPRMFRLSLVETQDIFMGLSVPEIIAGKLGAVGLADDHEMRLLASYPKRDFVVQYCETDLAFVSRLAEHLGISFFFEEDERGTDRVIFTDNPAGFHDRTQIEKISFRERGEARDVFELTARSRVVPRYYAVRDYNDQLPHIELTADHRLDSGYAGGVCDFGTHHRTPEEGKHLARVRAEERQAGQLVYSGQSALAGLRAGRCYRLEGHPDFEELSFLVTEVEHTAAQVVAMSGAGEAMGYKNTFRAIPVDRPFRPERITPRPRIHGLLHGIVDTSGTGVDHFAQIDDQGRYTVRFLFDTQPPGERAGSLPIRMLQAHVGENHGIHVPLKPGAEVLVGFVGGDPDRPVIVGAAHNPLTPATVTRKNATTHRIRTSGGVTFDIVDDP